MERSHHPPPSHPGVPLPAIAAPAPLLPNSLSGATVNATVVELSFTIDTTVELFSSEQAATLKDALARSLGCTLDPCKIDLVATAASLNIHATVTIFDDTEMAGAVIQSASHLTTLSPQESSRVLNVSIVSTIHYESKRVRVSIFGAPLPPLQPTPGQELPPASFTPLTSPSMPSLDSQDSGSLMGGGGRGSDIAIVCMGVVAALFLGVLLLVRYRLRRICTGTQAYTRDAPMKYQSSLATPTSRLPADREVHELAIESWVEPCCAALMSNSIHLVQDADDGICVDVCKASETASACKTADGSTHKVAGSTPISSAFHTSVVYRASPLNATYETLDQEQLIQAAETAQHKQRQRAAHRTARRLNGIASAPGSRMPSNLPSRANSPKYLPSAMVLPDLPEYQFIPIGAPSYRDPPSPSKSPISTASTATPTSPLAPSPYRPPPMPPGLFGSMSHPTCSPVDEVTAPCPPPPHLYRPPPLPSLQGIPEDRTERDPYAPPTPRTLRRVRLARRDQRRVSTMIVSASAPVIVSRTTADALRAAELPIAKDTYI